MNHKSSMMVFHKPDALVVSQCNVMVAACKIGCFEPQCGCSCKPPAFHRIIWLEETFKTIKFSRQPWKCSRGWTCTVTCPFLAFCCSCGKQGISKSDSLSTTRSWRYLTRLEAGIPCQRWRLDTILWAAITYTLLPPQQLTRWAQIKPLHHI